MKQKYFVRYDCEGKSLEQAVKTAMTIEKVCSGIAPDTYVMLSIYGDVFHLEIDDSTNIGEYLSVGIKRLEKLGYITINKEYENDDYNTIWIMK